MNENEELIESRNLRKAKYAIEDFEDAIGGLGKVALAHVVLILGLIFSVLMGAANFINIFFSLTTIAVLIGFRTKLSFRAHEMVFLGLGIFYFIFILELIIGGIPDSMLPILGLDNMSTRTGVVKLLNSISPFVYLGCRVILGYPFLIILQKLNVLKKIPENLLKKHNFHLEQY
jgi:hypothetical protein